MPVAIARHGAQATGIDRRRKYDVADGYFGGQATPLVTLQRIERALDPFRNQDPEKRVWRSADDRAQCAEQLQQCETLLAEIVSQEKCCEVALIHRRDEAAARLQGAHLAGHARHAYLPETDTPLSQLDLFSER